MDFLQWARYCLHALCKRGARDKGRKEKNSKSRSKFEGKRARDRRRGGKIRRKVRSEIFVGVGELWGRRKREKEIYVYKYIIN